MTLPDSLRQLIESGPLAYLSTINADGSPQVSAVWIGLDGDDLVSGHLGLRLKVRNVQRDPRAVLSFDAPAKPGLLLAEHAVLQVTATVTEGGAWDLVDRLIKTYVGPDETFPAPLAPGYIIRYHVDKVGGVGPWA